VGLFRKKQPSAEVTVHSEVVQATDYGALSEELQETLKKHGIDPSHTTTIDASEIPGLTEEIMGALNESGVWQQAFSGLSALGAPEHDDPVEQLDKLAELHKKGHLSDYEFALAKEKLLNQNWDQPG